MSKGKSKGQALIEFALCLPFLLLLALGFVEMGRALWTGQAISNAAREGARSAAITARLAENDPRIQEVVRNYLEKAAVKTEGVVVTNAAVTARGERIKVTVTFPYQYITPLPQILGLEALQISRATTMRYSP